MRNGAIGAWRPSFWAREARGPAARAGARYLKKRAASFFTRESLEQKCGNLLLMCAQWTNLGGVVFQFFENCLGNIEQILEPGGSQEEVRRKSRGSQEEVKRKSRGSQEEVKRKSRGPLVQKCIFGRYFSWRPISPLGSFGRPRLQNCRGRRFLRQPVQYAAGMLRVC